MRKAIATLLMLAALVAPASMAIPARAYEGEYTQAQKSECKFRRNDRWSKAEARDVIRCVSAKLDEITAAKMLDVSACESGYNAYAVSDSGTFRGLFQHHERYWPDRVRAAQRSARRILGDGLQTGVFNARSNTYVTAFMVIRNGWGAWSCG